MSTKFRKIKRNGKRRTVPINTEKKAIRERSLTSKEVEDLTGVGIKHPGSLSKFGYHISASERQKHSALNRAIREYGRKETLRKLGELYRLDFHRPALKAGIVDDIKYVSGGKRND